MSNFRQESSPEGLGNIKHKQSILGQSLEALMDLEGILRGFVCREAFCHSSRPSANLCLCAKGGHTLGLL